MIIPIPSNTVIKHWFANFVTGGGGVNVGAGTKKRNLQNSGIVGKQGLNGVQGSWQAVSQVSGKTVSCHFNTFTSLAFSGPATGSPPSTHSTAMFTTGPLPTPLRYLSIEAGRADVFRPFVCRGFF